ncbi:MAG: hypothetical protein CVV64_02865 [Candidatus Wallbacteria bacterium HGW-Wallbacteria-1]|jgi:putative nucleotidyltransferase with HDIG domain|uniref:HD-GYP domain-containing protein n=1 Tax=Candidatus Wallbacteria bacterium HGW-Wallbacteria-1 TaxID=2013854 RepID=A0A2N1PTF9_9BACT|nr:MAG: hypothetical protein CVV64_02865 [Candidatus Wallbacteria bacterium HGW-Wallbacteria-1]
MNKGSANLAIKKNGSIYESITELKSGNGPWIIGRGQECQICLESSSVSRCHARIIEIDGDYHLEDQDSTNKVFINRKAVSREILLNGDEIAIGDFKLRFTSGGVRDRIIKEILELIPQESASEASSKSLRGKRESAEYMIQQLQKKVLNQLFPAVLTPEGEELAMEFQEIRHAFDEMAEQNIAVQKDREILLSIGKISGIISSITDIRALLGSILEATVNVFKADHGFIMLARNPDKKLVPVLGRNYLNRSITSEEVTLSGSIATETVKTRKAVLTVDAARDPRFMANQSIVMNNINQVMCAPMISATDCAGAIYIEIRDSKREPFTPQSLEHLQIFANQAAVALENARLYGRIHKLYMSTIEALATALEYKDPYTKGHSKRVQQYSVALAQEMGLDRKQIETLEYAALLHDIGKIGIADSILKKAATLSEDEYKMIREHPQMGAKLMEPVQLLLDKIPSVRHHHEKWNGSGYPDGLSGDKIPLLARIIAVADTFDAMTSKRSYRDAMTPLRAKEEIQKNSGTQFDPEVVEVFNKIFDRKFLSE